MNLEHTYLRSSIGSNIIINNCILVRADARCLLVLIFPRGCLFIFNVVVCLITEYVRNTCISDGECHPLI